MTEHYHSPPSPEPNEDRQFYYGEIHQKLFDASDRVWISAEHATNSPETFTLDNSAAGLQIECSMPERPDGDFWVHVKRPSRRFRSAMNYISSTPYYDAMLFVVVDYRDTGTDRPSQPDVYCAGEYQKEQTYRRDLSYEKFLGLMDDAGLCDPASAGQRLARFTLKILEKYTNDSAILSSFFHPHHWNDNY